MERQTMAGTGGALQPGMLCKRYAGLLVCLFVWFGFVWFVLFDSFCCVL